MSEDTMNPVAPVTDEETTPEVEAETPVEATEEATPEVATEEAAPETPESAE